MSIGVRGLSYRIVAASTSSITVARIIASGENDATCLGSML